MSPLSRAGVAALFSLVLVAGVPDTTESPSNSEVSRQLLERYWTLSSHETPLSDVSMDVSISAAIPKLKKQGTMQALRTITKLGKVIYDKFTFSGDDQVKRHVILRFLTEEKKAAEQPADVAINDKNYKFKYKGLIEQRGRAVYVYEVTPRHKRIGLYKGELWLDATSGLAVRQAGRLVKSPSIFFKKTEFVRSYEILEGRAVLTEWKNIADTRIVGRVELDIKYSNYLSPALPTPEDPIASLGPERSPERH